MAGQRHNRFEEREIRANYGVMDKLAILNSGEVFFIASLVLYIVALILFQSAAIVFLPARLTGMALAGCAGMLVISELLSGKWNLRALVALGALAIMVVASIRSSSNAVFVIALFVFVSRNYEFETAAKAALITIAFTCLFVCLLAAFGITLNYVWHQGERIRYGLGFRYTTYLSHYILYSTMLLIYIRNGRIGWKSTTLIIILNISVFVLTDSRNSFLLTFVVLAAAPLMARMERSSRGRSKLIVVVAAAIMPLIALVSIYLMINYRPSLHWMGELNNFLGGRLLIASRTYQLYGITLLGQSFDTAGQGLSPSLQMSTFDYGVTFIDNSYCSIFLHQGVAAFVMVVIGFSATMGKLAANRKYIPMFILVIVAVHSFIDSWLLTLQYNVFILLVGSYLLSAMSGQPTKLMISARSVDVAKVSPFRI